MPTHRQLEIFCEAAADENFRATASRLGMSQPGVSAHIHALERKLGQKLFERRAGAAAGLSDAGRSLLETARQTVALSRRLAAGAAADRNERVIVGVRHYLLETVVRPAIPRFIDEHSDIDLDVQVVDEVADLVRFVRSGALDVAVYRGDPPPDHSLMVRVGGGSPCSIFAAREVARRIDAAATPLDDVPFILLPEPPHGVSWASRRLHEVGIRPRNIVLRSQFPAVMLQWVVEQRGAAVLVDETARAALEAGTVERIGPPIRPLQSQLLARNGPSDAVARVIDFLRALLKTP